MKNIDQTKKDKIVILVLAPRFPSINQPWMDTYLEQLLRQGLTPLIITENINPEKYSEKVDRLNLHQYILDFNLDRTLSILFFTKACIKNPLKIISNLVRAIRVADTFRRRYNLAFIPSFLKALRFGIAEDLFCNVDIIHSHSEILAFEFLFLVRIMKKPLFFTFHGMPPIGVPALVKVKRKALYGEVDKVFTNTIFSKKQVQEIGCQADKVVVLPQGLPLEDFSFLKRVSPKPDEALILLTVGRYHPEKGQRYALLALRRLHNMGINVRWNFVGTGPDLQSLRSFAKKFGVEQYVFFYKELNLQELRPLYQDSHLFVLPSLGARQKRHWTETQGVVLQEAQASGCIPIATNVGGIPECVNDMKDAIIVKDRSSREIADAIIYFLKHPEEWSRFQENGRHNVEHNFSADVIGKRMAEQLSISVKNKPI